MTRLNEVELWWNMKGSNDTIEYMVQKALESWNNKKDTRDVVPEFIVFHTNFEIEDKEVLDLKVIKEKTMLKNHFAIRGSE